jgi:hypothetical protein
MWFYPTVAAAVISFLAGWYINGLRLNAEIAQLHATWNEAYANQAKTTMEKERELNKLNAQVEASNANQEKAINDAHAKNIKLADDIKRLQQSTRASSSAVPSTGAACKCTGAAPQSGLSDESISLLVELAKEADDAARYANTCHEWAVGTTKELDKQR